MLFRFDNLVSTCACMCVAIAAFVTMFFCIIITKLSPSTHLVAESARSSSLPTLVYNTARLYSSAERACIDKQGLAQGCAAGGPRATTPPAKPFSVVLVKSNLHYTRRITPKRITTDGAHLRSLAPGLHSSQKTSQRWRAVGPIDQPDLPHR